MFQLYFHIFSAGSSPTIVLALASSPGCLTNFEAISSSDLVVTPCIPSKQFQLVPCSNVVQRLLRTSCQGCIHRCHCPLRPWEDAGQPTQLSYHRMISRKSSVVERVRMACASLHKQTRMQTTHVLSQYATNMLQHTVASSWRAHMYKSKRISTENCAMEQHYLRKNCVRVAKTSNTQCCIFSCFVRHLPHTCHRSRSWSRCALHAKTLRYAFSRFVGTGVWFFDFEVAAVWFKTSGSVTEGASQAAQKNHQRLYTQRRTTYPSAPQQTAKLQRLQMTLWFVRGKGDHNPEKVLTGRGLAEKHYGASKPAEGRCMHYGHGMF